MNVQQPTRAITLNAIEITFPIGDASIPTAAQQTGHGEPRPGKAAGHIHISRTGRPPAAPRIKIHFTGILNDELRGFYLSKTAQPQLRRYAI